MISLAEGSKSTQRLHFFWQPLLHKVSKSSFETHILIFSVEIGDLEEFDDCSTQMQAKFSLFIEQLQIKNIEKEWFY